MTSQFGCLELLITRTFLSGPVKFEITRVDCIWWQIVQIQISWLLKKPNDLDLHYLLRQGMTCLAREGLNPHSRLIFSLHSETINLLMQSVLWYCISARTTNLLVHLCPYMIKKASDPNQCHKVLLKRKQNMLRNSLLWHSDRHFWAKIFFLFLHENICCGYSLEVRKIFTWF